MSPLRPVLFVCFFIFGCSPARAQENKDDKSPRTDAEILKTVKLPDGYEATVFASPPSLGYPTSVSAAIDGTSYRTISPRTTPAYTSRTRSTVT